MTNLSCLMPWAFAVRAKLAQSLRFIAVGLFLLVASAGAVFSQTTYTWIGGNGAWNVATNWSPIRTTPATSDIIQFNDGGTYTVTAVPLAGNQTIGKLIVANNTNITLQGNGSRTITITGNPDESNFVIESGSTLSNVGASNIVSITLTSGQVADIEGTLNWNGGTFTATGNTINVSGALNIAGAGAITATSATLNLTGTMTTAGTGAANFTSGTVNIDGALTWGSTGAFTTTGATTTVAGTLNINAGTIVAGAAAGTAFNLSGTLNFSSTSTTPSTILGGNITGTFNMNSGTVNFSNATYPTTFTSTSVLNHTGGTFTSNATVLFFEAGANYNYLGTTTALTIPTANWDAASNVNITGINNGATVITILGLSGQSFGNFNYNCPSQGTGNVNLAATFTVKGDMTITSTGSGTLFHKISTTALTLTVNGNFNMNGGNFTQNSAATAGATLTVGGDFNMLNGTFNSSTANIACTINFDGNYNQTGGTFMRTGGTTTVTTINFRGVNKTYSQTGGTVDNTYINYAVNGGAGSLTLNSPITLAASRTFIVSGGSLATSGSLDLNGNDITFANGGSFTVNNFGTLTFNGAIISNSAGATTFTTNSGSTLIIDSPLGITATGGGTNGHVQVTSTRTFNAGAHYVYVGTNGQVTGNGLPGTTSTGVTGSITVNLSDGGALTLSNSPTWYTISGTGVLRMVNGSLANAARFVNTNTCTLEYAGIAAQTTTDNEWPASTNPPNTVIINNPNGVTMHDARSIGVSSNGTLTLTEGILNTTSSTLVTVNATAVTGISGGSPTSYVNGPLAWNRTGASAGNVFNFPVGKSVYAPLSYTNGTAGQTTYVVEYFEDAPTAAAGLGLTAVGDSYWRVQRTAGTVDVLTSTVTLTESGILADSRIGYSPDNSSTAFVNIGGNGPASSISSLPITIGADNYFTIGTGGTLSGTQTAYTTLTSIAEALRTMLVTGDVVFELPTTYAGEPGYPVVFTEFAEDGNGPYNVTIRPAAGSANFLTAGDPGVNNTPLIDFDGIDRLTIDGRPGGIGTAIEWTFRHTRVAAGATFRFINDATYNTLTYLNAEGENTNTSTATAGTILFSTSTGTLGNSNNTISYCHIRNRQDAANLPLNGIYSVGQSAAVSNTGNIITGNRIYNNFVAGTGGAGIWLGANNIAWTISDNHFYHTTARTGSGAVTRYGIYIASTGTGSTNYVITGNYIGGSEENAGGAAMTINGNVNQSFQGIYISTLAAGSNVIENNVIRNITLAHGAAFNATLFVGIYDNNGNNRIAGNTIGSLSGTDGISISSVLGTVSTAYGIYLASGADTVSNNVIAGINLASTTGGVAVTGIHTAATSGSPTVIIENNTVAKLSSAYTGTSAAYVRGIYTTGTTAAGIRTIRNNNIYELSSAAGNTGSGATSIVAGIVNLSTNAGLTISGNTVHSLGNTHATAATNVVGIHTDAAASGTNIIEKNYVHSLTMATSSTTTATAITGINLQSGLVTVANNMVRLGIDKDGNGVTGNYLIRGIHHVPTTANSTYYFNTVYVGGNNVAAGTNKTYAFYRTAASGNILIKNNIFYNARSNDAGTGTHFAVGIANMNGITGVNVDYNYYHAGGVGGAIGENAGNTQATLLDWKSILTNIDANSLTGTLNFVNATGDASAANLHISPGATQIESAGTVIAGWDTDIDGDLRFGHGSYAGTGTAPDMGADESDFLALDLTPPTIVYTPISNQTNYTAPLLSATITDNIAVETAAGLAPRIYFKRSTDNNTFAGNTSGDNGWKYIESTTGSSPFEFTIDYSLLFGGSVAAGDTIQYFVVAQDNASTPNVGINSGDFNNPSAASVDLAAGDFPLTGTINSYVINILSGTVYVGAGEKYPSLTNEGGLFQAINSGALDGNLVAEITSDLTAELGTYALNQWTEVNGSGYTVTIRPNAAVTRTISGNQNLELFRLDGADRLTIDGSYAGSGKYLVFANTNTGTAAATFSFLNEATENTIRNCYLRGSTTATTKGVVFFGASSATTTLGNSNNTIEYCDIHDNAGVLPRIGVYSAGTNGKLNINNTISNNKIYNFFNASGSSAGVWLVGNTSAWTIENNTFYQEATRTSTSSGIVHYVINITNTSNANSVIRGNYIGGNAADGTGTMTYTAATTHLFAPIYLSTSNTTAQAVLVENNTITNIDFTTTSGATSATGPFTAIYQAGGASIIKGNNIGSATNNGAIDIKVTNAGGVSNAIRYDGSATVKIENNTIGGITVTGTVGGNNGQNFYAINATTGNLAIKNNTIGSATTPASIQINGNATSNASVLGGINIVGAAGYADSIVFNTIQNLTNYNGGTNTRVFGISATSAAQYTIEDNIVRDLRADASASVGTTTSAALMGIAMVTSNTQPLSLSRNKVYGLTNGGIGATAWTTGMYYSGATNTSNKVEGNFVHSLTPSTGASANVCGIQIVGGANISVRNNMVRLGIDAAGNNISQAHTIYGIDVTSTSASNIFHNSVYIGGEVPAATALNSFAFRRTATSGTINIQNNIFMNARTQAAGGKHYAIYTPNTTTFTSDYNILYATGTGTYTGLFNTTDAASLADWRTATSNKDLNSLSCDPNFINPTGDATNVDLHISNSGTTPVEGRGNPVALSPAVTVDFDGDTRDVPSVNTVDIGADAGNFTASRAPSLAPTANSDSPLTTCVNSAVNFAAVPSGGALCGAWEYSWFNGTNYWNGSAFASANEVFNTAWENISVSALSTGGTYTVKVRCSGDAEGCIAPQTGTVDVTLNGATTLTPSIGTPANGLSHNMNLSWTAAAGASAYEVEVSTDTIVWSQIYSGNALSYTHDAGDNPNVSQYYRIRAIYGGTPCNWVNASQFPIYTAADAPALPILNNPTAYTIDLTLDNETPVANPAITTYSIRNVTTNQYVQADGSLGATEVFQTKADWGTVTVTGLLPSTNYCFHARAKNNDGDVREGLGGNVLPVQGFDLPASLSTVSGSGPTNAYWSPSSCTTGGLTYFASAGCADGSVGKSYTGTGTVGCFLRTPEVSAVGNTEMKVFFDITHSYNASYPNDRIKVYMWSDNSYKQPISIRVNGVEASLVDINGRYLPMNMLRNCEKVEATFDMTTTSNLNNGIYFYIEPNKTYTANYTFNAFIDNVSVLNESPTACLSTAPLLMDGDYTVGNGGDFPSLTNPGGLFETVNMATFSGNVTATVISDLTSESGLHPLNQWAETGAGNYKLTLRPSNDTVRVITGNYVGANAGNAGLYRIDGASRFIVDGRNPADLNAGGRHLLFRNQSNAGSTFNSTFNFINDAKNDTLRYVIIEGASTSGANGVVRFSTASAGGNDNITIDNCHIRDVLGSLPANGIYASGTAGQLNSGITISNNEIYNYWHASTTSAHGIFVEGGNTDWTISGNSLYQTASRAGGGTVIHYGIRIENSSNGNNFQVLNNYVGGSEAFAGGSPWTITGSTQVGFIGISVNGTTSSSNLVQGNTVTNFDISTTRIAAFPTNTFTGILAASNGQTTMDNNVVGSDIGTGSIVIRANGTGGIVVGIGHSTSTGDVIITNNKVGAFEITPAASYSVSFNGIRYGQGASNSSRTISGNLIGSLTTANSIYVNTGSTNGTAQNVIGINMTGGANAVSITNNTIANMHNNRPAAGTGQTIGIYSPFGTNTITGNTIFNLSTTSDNTSTGSSAALAGILLSATSANGHLISQNNVYALKKTVGGGIVSIIGIYYGGASSGNNNVSRNLVHSLSSTGSGTLATGIYMGAGSVTVSNNMIRLGIDETGADITYSISFQGIVKDNTATNNFVYYNSVYIGGSNVGLTVYDTYAFRRIQTNANDNVRNNIFVNVRSNAATGGVHYGVHLNNSTTLVMRNNLIYTNGTGTVFGRINATNYTSLGAWSASGFGSNTVSADPQFVAPTAATPDLNLTPGVSNPAESGAEIIAGLEDDFAATGVRTGYPQAAVYGGGTAPDMGADETDMQPVDLTPPTFVYTNIPTQSPACAPLSTTVEVTINDPQSGISLTNDLPRLYFRRKTGAPTTTWSYTNSVEGTFVSGNANSSVWSFTIDYATFGITTATGNEFEYYFVAQDLAPVPNIGTSQSNGSVPLHSDVATIVDPANYAFPASGVFSFGGTPLSGTVTVGSGGDYTNFNNNSTGLFKAIADRGLSGDLTVEVISNVNEGADYYPLYEWDEYCGSGYTITIKSSAATVRTIASNASGANGLIHLSGCKRVIIDGSIGGTGRYLLFRQASTLNPEPPTIYITGGTQDVEIKNCVIEGNNRQTINQSNFEGPGVVNLGLMGGSTTPISNIIIDNNVIRNRSDIAQNSASYPHVLIAIQHYYSTATAKSNIAITNNELLNFRTSAVWAERTQFGNSVGGNFNISGNRIYELLDVTDYHQYPIYFDASSSSSGNIIANNIIGGKGADLATAAFWNMASTVTNLREFWGIFANAGGTSIDDPGCIIRGNVMHKINAASPANTSFIGIQTLNGYHKIINNMIGDSSYTGGSSIAVQGGQQAYPTSTGVLMGIWARSNSESFIDSNVVSNLETTGPYSFIDGMAIGSNLEYYGSSFSTPAGKTTVTNNVINKLRSSSALQSNIISSEGLIGMFVHSNGTGNLVENNTIDDIGVNGGWNRNTRAHGVILGVFGSGHNQTGNFSKNKITRIFNTNTGDNGGTINPEIYGLSVAYGTWAVSNNMIYIDNAGLTDRNTSISGIRDGLLNGTGSGKYFNNTVYVAGTNGGSGTANASYAFIRFPINYQTITLATGAPTELSNNIFINSRGGTGNHRAIGNIASNTSTGWPSGASNYNFLSNANQSVIGRWGAGAPVDYDFAGWKTTSGSDKSSWSVPVAGSSSTTQINPADLFMNASVGDLRINPANQAAWFVNGKGVAGAQNGNLSTDIDGDPRTTTYGYGVDIGADEFTPNVGVLPHALTATPAAGGTNTFTFAGRTIGSITWGSTGTVPTSITARYYSGDEPGTNPSPAYSGIKRADFMTEFTPTGGSGYSYTATLNYDDALLGSFVVGEGNMKMIKTISNAWTDVVSTVDTVNNTLTNATALTSFSFFSGGESPTPLPIELLSFDANCAGDYVKLNWSTATEINNQEFIIHRSADLMMWEEVARVTGAGNSNQVRHYTATDERPLDGLAYYRLTQRDYDGTSESFEPVSVYCQGDGAGNMMSIYPNPATDNFKVSITLADAVSDATIIITDMNGKHIAQRNVHLPKGTTELSFDTVGMNTGSYIVQLKSAGVVIKPVKLIIK